MRFNIIHEEIVEGARLLLLSIPYGRTTYYYATIIKSTTDLNRLHIDISPNIKYPNYNIGTHIKSLTIKQARNKFNNMSKLLNEGKVKLVIN